MQRNHTRSSARTSRTIAHPSRSRFPIHVLFLFSLALTKLHGVAMPIVQTSSRDLESVNAMPQNDVFMLRSIEFEIIIIYINMTRYSYWNCKK